MSDAIQREQRIKDHYQNILRNEIVKCQDSEGKVVSFNSEVSRSLFFHIARIISVPGIILPSQLLLPPRIVSLSFLAKRKGKIFSLVVFSYSHCCLPLTFFALSFVRFLTFHELLTVSFKKEGRRHIHPS